MTGLHLLDYVVIAAYFLIVIVLGKIAAKEASSGDGFFLAGRKLGKVYQFFLNFGNSADANGAVSTASVVYQQGVSGVWVGFQSIFLNPYYWFMYSWFRRVRLTTMADLFEDRLGSRRLALFYATFQIVMAVSITIGFSNLVSYKISAALVTKQEASWSPEERQSVEDYRELKRLEASARATPLAIDSQARLTVLRERELRGELNNYVSALNPWVFYIGYTLFVGIYIVMGGMAATALNEVFQSILIVFFSIILIPIGLAAIGGWEQLGKTVPAEMFRLFGTAGSSVFTGWTIAAVFLATLMQTHALPANMAIAGSAKSEFAARFGAVSGTFGKRITTIMWAFCGLVAVALFSGEHTLADADLAWGTMSLMLLGPGLLGLMFAGVLAAQMSTVAAQSMAVSALFARNIYRGFRPNATDLQVVRAARWALIAILIVGIFIASQVSSVYTVLQFTLTTNVPFGASILLMFIWRRVTEKAVWAAVIGSAFINIFCPLIAQHLPALSAHPTLVTRTVDAAGRPTAVFFESVVRTNPADAQSALEGRGRLHTELVILQAAGMDVSKLSAGGRLAGRFFVDALLPIVLLLSVSMLTRRPPQDRVDQFFGKMKTPVAATLELDAVEMAATRRNPHRHDASKLLSPSSSWEFTRWNTQDTVGFAIACSVTFGLIGLFLGLLKLAAP